MALIPVGPNAGITNKAIPPTAPLRLSVRARPLEVPKPGERRITELGHAQDQRCGVRACIQQRGHSLFKPLRD